MLQHPDRVDGVPRDVPCGAGYRRKPLFAVFAEIDRGIIRERVCAGVVRAAKAAGCADWSAGRARVR